MPSRRGERYASALSNMSLNNKVYKRYGKTDLKNYIQDFIKMHGKSWNSLNNGYLHILLNMYNTIAGNYCESVIPDPIPNSEVKPFSANGTLS